MRQRNAIPDSYIGLVYALRTENPEGNYFIGWNSIHVPHIAKKAKQIPWVALPSQPAEREKATFPAEHTMKCSRSLYEE
ncbi:MAG: hypothetical protein ACLP9S_01160 [Syntrophales bacterium]